MLFDRLSIIWKILLLLLTWLLIISYSHYWLNTEHSSRKIMKMGYMPVITNLSAPLLDYASKDGDGVRFKALKFASFAEMAEALRNNEIQIAFIIAPLSIVMRQQGEDIKIIYIGNRHESTLVTRKELNIHRLSDLEGKTVAVPLRYSGHNLSILKLLEDKQLSSAVNVVEMNPPDMASALASGALDAYYVGEPFAAQTLKSGQASLLHHVEDVWPNFICNLVIVQQSLIKDDPETIQKFVRAAARAGIWSKHHRQETIDILGNYWSQSSDLVEYALTTPKDRIRYDEYIPKQDEMAEIADMMVHYGLLKNADIQGLIDDRFARSVTLDNITDLPSIFQIKGDGNK